MFVTPEEDQIGFSCESSIALWSLDEGRIVHRIPLMRKRSLRNVISADGCVLLAWTVDDLKLFTFRKELFPVGSEYDGNPN